ncbi:ATP-dependent helicase [Vibrio vulnificus]|uniref:UvrD-helicase domain-containing protein n=1 Tax=Vibrio vulnificus TaxID=672 RepID=UPI0015FBA663|nr:ATP-dependent helicase [Vibrio vulnificus]MCA0763934.1 ATP-dependent helicase [Vibrio vulnificus]MDT8824031.1 ATP-dependent helicase [Vibrio vulnificus]MDT9655275.1 ATP-dependent helicase [Vibrio vulnificus]QMV39191.1 ATP-dependent helicase [Vibrio vulnificus]HAS6164689.1 AAA family ATPase [Vibrio vulnificus]
MAEWQPSDGIEATDELVDIITCDASVAVLASAGAGKTELLAQKASYLFYTNNCAWPKRILSLTFKTEAQLNIKERISKRCGDKANRFDSFTFHAFSKSIVDRFKNVLPEGERPVNNYDIVFRRQDSDGRTKILMNDLLALAIRILREREDIRIMFSCSYAYVFVDEFQDTTNDQYELLQLLFQSSETKVLTVGDINQSIMLWAGARQTVFTDFLSDFSAKKKLLVKNYRASSEIQDVLAVVLQFVQNQDSTIQQIAHVPNNCSLHSFIDEYQEARFISDSIKEALDSGVRASDISILTKQQASRNTEVLRAELTRNGINNLDMTDLQDALKEPLGQLFTLFLKAIVHPEPQVITELFKVNLALNKVDPGDDKEEALTNSLIKFIHLTQQKIIITTTADELLSLVLSFIHELGMNKIKGRWKQYKSPEYFNHVWRALEIHLINMCNQTSSLVDAVRLFSTENAVHLMNIHKCKGLEYHTVYFIGLEDQEFWNYASQTFEDNCSIYVALSRAKNCICVTTSKHRAHRQNRGYDNRTSTYRSVRPVIDLLINKCKFSATNH